MRNIIVLAVSVVLLQACEKKTEPYNAQVVANFVNSCVQSGGDQAFCACTIDEMQKIMPQAEFLAHDTTVSSGGQMPEKMAKALGEAKSACLGKGQAPGSQPAAGPGTDSPSPAATAADAVPQNPPVSAGENSSLCMADKIIFSCKTKNKKQVDVCDSGKEIAYFYGKSASELEMSLFVPRSSATTRQWDGMGGSMSYAVNIPNGNTTYSVYWSAVRDPDAADPVSAGIEVIINGVSKADIACVADSVQQNMEGIDLPPASL